MSDRIEAEILDVFGEEVAAAVDTPLVVIKGSKGDPGKDGITPTIGPNGNWYLGEEDTGKPSRGATGTPGAAGHSPVVTATKSGKTTTISVDGAAIATVEDGADGAPGARGADGITPTIGANGNWYLGTTDTGKPSRGATGAPGKDGAGMDITGATVGQIAKITAVDASGVPTAWSPADMPSGGSSDAVLYTAQELTYGQKFQARKNIEAADRVMPTITGGVSLCPANVTDSNTAVHTTTTTAGGDDFTLTLDGGPENALVRVKGIRTPTDADTNAAANVEYVKDSIPTALKNPNALTFTGAVTGSYDGAAPLSVNIPTVPTKTSQLTNDSGFLTSHQDISGKQDKSTLEADVASKGFTKNTGTYSKPTGGIPKADLASAVQSSLGKADSVDALVPDAATAQNQLADKLFVYAQAGQVTPLFANSTADCTDTTKVYVLPDGYIYGYINGAWTNTGHQFTNTEALEKVIDATCDIETISGGNYNLLKVSEVSFSSRLQNDIAGIIASTATNVVTGWIPVTYGKYYCPSTKLNDGRTVYRISIPRVQLKLADDTIDVYAANVYPIDSAYRTLAVENPNAVAMRLQFQIMNSSSTAQDISTSEKIKAFEPMVVEGSTADEAYNNSLNFDYLDGDVAIPAIVNYTLKHDFTKADKAYVDSLFSVMVDGASMLHKAQKYIAEDWRIPFVDAPSKLGLGSNHIIPASYNLWGGTGNDLDQKSAMMQDGVHPYLAVGGNYMYAQAVAAQISVLPPLYSESSEHDDWQGKTILWTGASLTAGSDPYAPGVQTPYPTMVATRLGATSINIAKGSSCVRVNASDGVYSMFKYSHFIRALSRTVAEADWVQANWNTIKTNMIEAPATIPSADVEVMKQHSFENLLLPYLNGTHPMPDLFIFDHGHNDVRPRGVDGKQDSLVLPTASNIASGVLAEDTYMTANNYANLKLALNNDLSRVPKLTDFVASLNRNCYIGAMNFLFTLIYRYNPKARIILISDYN